MALGIVAVEVCSGDSGASYHFQPHRRGSDGRRATGVRSNGLARISPTQQSVCPHRAALAARAARDVTALGSTIVLGIVLFAVVGYMFIARKRAEAWLMLGAVLGGVALNNILKFSFARPRPDLVAPAARVFTPSFPSGHATMSAITYLTLGALLAHTHASRPMRIYFMSLAALLTVLVGLSRVYLGVHYPTDVLAGWCIGTAWAMACWLLMTWLQREGRVDPPERP